MIRMVTIAAMAVVAAAPLARGAQPPSITVGTFAQEVRDFFGVEHGLADADVLSLAITPDGVIWAGTAKGLSRYAGGAWADVEGFTGAPVPLLATQDAYLVAVFRGALHMVTPQPQSLAPLPPSVRAADQLHCLSAGAAILLGTDEGLFRLNVNRFEPLDTGDEVFHGERAARGIAVGPGGDIAVVSGAGLFYSTDLRAWERLTPHEGERSWNPRDVRATAFDAEGRLWFASPQGVGCLGDGWTLYTGAEGLPYNDFTAMAAGPDGAVWFGTRIGAIRYDGRHWAYRQGLRWLPNDDVRAVVVDAEGRAWFATPAGVGCIRTVPMTLAEKARFYEDEIDKYHRRTEYGYVLEVGVGRPGEKVDIRQSDSDNDGLWTSMYGAGECFAYAATGDPKARERAKQAFEALRFLSVAPVGGSKPSPPGFVARTVVPVDGGWNPNESVYTVEKDERTQRNDRKWKILHPRWPVSADGKWYYKCDTSSDELDGHYFFYSVYHDLVAETEEEKARVRDVVAGITDHLVENGFNLIDWDGTPTRWAVFGPEYLNHDVDWWEERGLNSLSILSYLRVAEHMTGDPKYRTAYDTLVRDHAYATNTLVPKVITGYGGGNQSDDEMAFMNYYTLLKYEKDPELRNIYLFSLRRYWEFEAPEMNPFFNFICAVHCTGEQFVDTFGATDLAPTGDWLEDAVETLLRFPLDRFNWAHRNSHRTDIQPLPPYTRMGGSRATGYRRNGKVVPVDETFFNHWNHDVWALDVGGDGRGLATGAVYLLPYYMGLYHGYIIEE